MGTSFTQALDQECPQCHTKFGVDLWMVVDTQERPDLLEQIVENSIHAVICPAGHTSVIDAPLLVYDPLEEPILLFAPAQYTTDAEDLLLAALLIDQLPGEMSGNWNDHYSSHLPIISKQHLRDTLMRRYTAPADHQLPGLINQFVSAQDRRMQRQLLRKHHALLSDEADALMQQIIDIMHQQGETNGAQYIEQQRKRLKDCRRRGIDKAFAEQIVNDNDPSVQIDFPAELLDDLDRFWEINERARRDPSFLPERMQIIGHLLDQLLPDEYPQFRASLLNDLSRCWMQLRTGDRQENLRQALAILQQGLCYTTAEGTPDEYGRLNRNIGLVYWKLRAEPREQNLRQAARCFSEVLRVRTPERSLSQHLITLADLGDVYRDIKDLSQATTCYERMLDTAYQYEHPEGEQTALAKLGYLVHEAGQLDKALDYYRLATAIPLSPEGSRATVITVLERQANIYREKKLTWHMIDSLARAIAVAQERNDQQRIARLSKQLWFDYRWFGQLHIAPTGLEADGMALSRAEVRRQELHNHGETATLDAALDWAEAGHTYHQIADSENAVTCFERMLRIGDVLSDLWILMHALIGLGRAKYQLGERKHASACFDRALTLARQIQIEPTIALALDYLAQVYRELGRLDLSGSTFLEAIDFAHQFGRSKQQEETLHRLELATYQLTRTIESVVAGQQPSPDVPDTIPGAIQADARIISAQNIKDVGNWLSATLTLEEARHIAAESGSLQQHLVVAIALGRIYQETGAAAKAVQLLLEAYQIECDIHSPPNILPILIDLAHCYDFLQDWQRAAETYIEAFKCVDEDEDPLFACQLLFSIGWCYSKQQENMLATRAYHQALSLSDAAGNPELTWSIQSELGTIVYRAAEYEEAFTWHQTALRTAEFAGLVQRTMESAAKISYLFMSIGDMNQAITWGNHWLEYARREKHDGQYVRACMHLGEMYQRAGLLQHAMKCFRDVLTIAGKYHDTTRQCAAAISIGDLYNQLEDSARAIEWYCEVIRYAESPEDQMAGHHRLARVYQQTEQYALARQSYKTLHTLAHNIQSSNLEAQSLLELGMLEMNDGAPDEAIQSLEAAHAIYQELGELTGTAMALAHLGTAYYTKEAFSRAVTYYKQALQHSEAFSTPADVAKIERDTADALALLGRSAEALQYANSAKMSFIALNLQEEADDTIELINQIRSQELGPQKHDTQDTTQTIRNSVAQSKEDDEIRVRLRALLESADDGDFDEDSDDDLAEFMDALEELDGDND